MTTYAIRNKNGLLRFVEARNEAQGIRHCARGEFTASLPTIAEAIEFGRSNGVIEIAGPEPVIVAEPKEEFIPVDEGA